jgi:octaprenyl-diphosphate synthase
LQYKVFPRVAKILIFGAISPDALALFPDSPMKTALAETVDFCIARTH